MNKFLKRLSNFIVYVVTLLGIFTLFSEKIDPLSILITIILVLFTGFVFLVLWHISQLEKRITHLKQKFIRAEELKEIRRDVEAFKLLKLMKQNGAATNRR